MNKLKTLARFDAAKDKVLPTLRRAQPFRIDPEGAKEAVLLLHGLTGNPSELRPIGDALAAQGYAVYAPRHPGHGTCLSDFLRSGAEDWLRSSIDAYLDLKADYGTIHVLGHSMGGLLASSVAMTFDAPKLVLLAPAYILSGLNVNWTIFLSRFKHTKGMKKPLPEEYRDDPEMRRLHEEYWCNDFVSPVAELFLLAKAVSKNIKRLRSRTFVIVGEKDPVVPVSTADLIARIAVNAQSMDSRVLAGGSHIFPFDQGSAEAIKLVLDWIGKPR